VWIETKGALSPEFFNLVLEKYQRDMRPGKKTDKWKYWGLEFKF